MMLSSGHRSSGQGQALVEFALVLPVIVILILGTLEVGRAVYLYNTLSQASRQGARTAIVNQNSATVRSTAVDYAPSSGLAAGDVAVCFEEPDATVSDCAAPGSNSCLPLRSGCLAIVTSRLTYDPLTPLVSGITGNIVLTSTSVLPIEYACTTGCP